MNKILQKFITLGLILAMIATAGSGVSITAVAGTMDGSEVSISGGEEDNPTLISENINYISSNTSGYYKLMLPKFAEIVEIYHNQFTTVNATSSKGGVYTTDYSDTCDTLELDDGYLDLESRYLTLHISTTKTDNCYFSIKIYKNDKYSRDYAEKIELNEEKSFYQASTPFLSSTIYYKFIAPRSTTYTLSTTYVGNETSIDPDRFTVQYKDGEMVSDDNIYLDNNYNKGTTNFKAVQGVVYYIKGLLYKKGNFTVSITPLKVNSIDFSTHYKTLYQNDDFTLSATVAPENAENTNLIYTSSDESVATVDEDGVVTANKIGTTTITATAADGSGVTDECTIEVIKNVPKPGKVKFKKWKRTKLNSKNKEKVSISWSKVEGATGYQVKCFYKNYYSSKWSTIDDEYYKDPSVYIYGEYYKNVKFKVRAYVKDQNGTKIYGPWSTTSIYKGPALPDGEYYYCDTTEYGHTKVSFNNKQLTINGMYYDYSYESKTLDTRHERKGKLKLKVASNVKIYGWEEGVKTKVAKKSFKSWYRYGCALTFKIKNNKIVRIDVSPYTG